MSYPGISAHELRLISALAECDPRSIHNYMQGRGRSTVASRIGRALAELGRFDLVAVANQNRSAQLNNGE